MVQKHRLYKDLSYLWPLISPPGESLEEAIIWNEILLNNLGEGPHRILDLGVGGGHLLSHLTYANQTTAVDISNEMLSLSKKLNPDVIHYQGDMRNIRLDQIYDAVLIHDSISYLLNEQELFDTFVTAKHHLRKDGVLLLGPGHLRIEQDHHTTGLFSTLIWTQTLENTGFTVTEDFFPRYEGGYGGHIMIGQLS